ncbi:MAG TPA: D-ribose pyranase [Spirochaeta sp.]|nr:D-ribose pyranase [Spirochaeta sp.]
MKKKGILNSEILKLIASAGHGDLIIITDRGFPLPSADSGVQIVDLGIAEGLPSFMDIVSLISTELEVEKIVHAGESLEKCPELIAGAKKLFGKDLPCSVISHTRLKAAAVSGRDEEFGRIIGFIRTGEFTPYANIVLSCGVVF